MTCHDGLVTKGCRCQGQGFERFCHRYHTYVFQNLPESWGAASMVDASTSAHAGQDLPLINGHFYKELKAGWPGLMRVVVPTTNCGGST